VGPGLIRFEPRVERWQVDEWTTQERIPNKSRTCIY
jgi:hypothetical protein